MVFLGDNPDFRDDQQIRYVPDNRYRLPDYLTDITRRSILLPGLELGDI